MRASGSVDDMRELNGLDRVFLQDGRLQRNEIFFDLFFCLRGKLFFLFAKPVIGCLKSLLCFLQDKVIFHSKLTNLSMKGLS